MSWWSFEWRLWNASGLPPIQHQLSGGSAWLHLSGSHSLSDRCLSLGRMTGLEMGDVWMPLWNCTYGRRVEKHGQGSAERERKREKTQEKEREWEKRWWLSSRFNDFTIWLWCRPHLTEMKSTDIMELFLLQTQNEQLTSIKYINLTMYQLYFKWIFLWNHAERDILCLYSNHNMSCHICWMWKAEELCVAGDFSEEYALNIHSTCSLVYFNLVSQHSFWVTAFRAE